MTIYDEICPSCDRTDSTHWAGSTSSTDSWACRCGYEWTITAELMSAEVP